MLTLPGEIAVAEDKTPDLRDQAPRSPLVDAISMRRETGESNVNDHISRHLKLIYDAVASQPIPDRLLELLNQLDERANGD
jgi:anti-sigma factor NepR-like protein